MKKFHSIFLPTILSFLISILISTILTSCIKENEEPATSLSIGDKCPQFTILMDDGETVATSDLAGNESMIVFFNTGCSDCRQELPEIQKVYATLLAENSPIRIICISREEGAQSIERFWSENNLSLPYSAQTSREIYSLFASSVIPRIYILSPDLTIKAIFTDNPLPSSSQILAALE